MTYRQRFIDETSTIINDTRNNGLEREERMRRAKIAVDEYVLQHSIAVTTAQELENKKAEETGRKPRELPFNPPESDLIERLTDAILHEELSDPDVYKVTHNEYPFLSERQFERRRSEEVGLKVAEEVGIDGKDHKPPKRRKRTGRENRFVNLKARAKNKELAKKYREFTEVQPVTTYTLGREEIDAYLSEKYTEYQRKYTK